MSKFKYTMALTSALGIALHERIRHLHPSIGGGKMNQPILQAAMTRAAENGDLRLRDAIVEVVPGCTNDLAMLVVEDFRIILAAELENHKSRKDTTRK